VSDTDKGIKLLGEVVVPGASQFIDGNIRSGTLHLVGAVAAVAMLGGPGGFLLAALLRGNSFTSSTVHKPLHKALFEGEGDKADSTSSSKYATA